MSSPEGEGELAEEMKRREFLQEEQRQKEREQKIKTEENRAKFQEREKGQEKRFEEAKKRESQAKGPGLFSRLGKAAREAAKAKAGESRNKKRRPRKARSNRRHHRKSPGKTPIVRRRHGTRRGPEYYEYLRLKRKFER